MTRLGFSLSRYAARCGAGGLLIVSLVIGGLLSVPTRCTCGAERPHEHSLFTLPGHWHSQLDQDPSARTTYSHYDGPIITFGGTATFVGATADLVADALSDIPDGVLASAPHDAAPAAGRGEAPERPPPRV
jgi:hypothetical protein